MISIDIHRHFSRLLLLLCLPLLTACVDDLFSGNGSTNGELPVTFDFALPTTRATSDNHLIEDRKTFTDKDVIHIEGTFTCSNGEKKVRYGAMAYDKAKNSWTAVANSELTWPDDATNGSFKAYFVHRRDGDLESEGGIIQKEGKTPTYSLSDLTYENDPLSADTKNENIPYGHAVKLNFEHVCTYLTLKGLGAKVADSYWFTRKVNLNNSFYLKRNDNNTLEFKFCQVPDERFHRDGYTNALVYINTKTVTGDDGTKVQFFLEPGNYDSFTLCYPGAESNFYDYLEYTYVPSQGDPETGPTLVANKSYLLDISKSKGITISTPPPGPAEETWDDGNDYIDVEVDKFLKAVADGTDYYYNETQILQGGSNSTKLLHNISFKKTKYSRQTLGFEPIVKEGSIFDGGHHYIKDISCPVFHRNRGTIRNLGLREIDAEFISDEADMGTSNKDEYDQSRNGILCGWNERGAVENIRIARAKITAKVKNDTETEEDKDASQEAHNIGCVIGSNTGTVTNVALAGTFTLTVEAYTGEGYNKDVDASVMIGGIVGQNAENGSITNVAPYEDTDPSVGEFVFKIENKCTGELGAFYVGGVAGLSSASISWVTLPNVTIDGSASKCVAMYMGGIAGQLLATGSGSNTAATSSCAITGAVKAGVVNHANKGDIAAKSYIGGISGVLGQSVTDCRTAVSVSVGTTANANVTYATGGAFGRILKTSGNIALENIMAYGGGLTGPTNYIGNFAGIAPVGKTWADAYEGHNIIVQKYGDYEYIGRNQDEE